MKAIGLMAFCCLSLAAESRADLTITQRIEGGGQSGEVTIKIKGDKERIDSAAQPSRIIDGSTGEMITVIPEEKRFVRVSAEQMKAAAETISKFNGEASPAAKSKLTATGKKEALNGYDTEEYTYETPEFKASFWIAKNYPNAVSILKQMQTPVSRAWKPSNLGLPDYRDFPGVPLKTVISVGTTEVTTTVASIKEGTVADSEFAVPKDYQQIKPPAVSASPSGENKAEPAASATP